MSAATEGYAAFLETLPDAAVVVDGAGRIRLANAKARGLLGDASTLLVKPAATAATRELRRRDGTLFSARVRTSALSLDGEALTLVLLADDLEDERLQQAVKLVGTMGFFDHDQVHDQLHVSAAYRSVAGFGPDEPVSLPALMERVHPDDRAPLLAAVQRAHAPGGDGSFEIEYRLVRPDGTTRWLAARSQTFFEGAGPERRPVRTVGAGIDITKRREEEAAMRTWYQAVASASSGLAVGDLTGRLTYVNRAFLEMWGLGSELEAVGRSALDFWAQPDEAARVLSGLGESPRWTGDLLGRRRDGTTFPVLFSASVIFDAHGTPVSLLGSFLDITERKRAEAERERLKALLDATPDVVVVGTLDGRVQYLNHAARQLRGIADDQPLEGLVMTTSLPPSERPKLEAGIQAALEKGTWRDEVVFINAEGQRIDYSVVLLVWPGEGGRPNTMAVIGRDVSRQRALEAQLRQSQKMEAVGRLAGGVAHDFNNLLTVINANCELLLGEPEFPPPLREDLQMVHAAGTSAAQLTRQLLAFSRKQVLQPVTLDLNALMGNVEKMLRRVIGEDIELVTHRAPDLWSTRVDRAQMEQVLVNLAVNARDAMPDGGKLTLETGNVTLDAEYASRHAEVAPGEYVMLAVTDNGIPREMLHKVFEPFFSTKGARGTGLGLSTVYGIVKQSGGNVNVYSEPGKGTTFRIYLPRDVAQPGAPQTTTPAPRAPVEPATVLVVEDSEGVRELVRKFLEGRGHTVLCAANGEDALRLAEERHAPLELLVTDVVMPGMGGRQLADELRRTHPRLEVLYMSGYTENAIVHHGVLDAGLDFIAKPFAIDAFAAQVDALLRRRKK
ncbi:MAG: PAS domain S-box protein [Myxococcota bacterium]